MITSLVPLIVSAIVGFSPASVNDAFPIPGASATNLGSVAGSHRLVLAKGTVFGPADISLKKSGNSKTLTVDATGFENLEVSFDIKGIGSINANCGTGRNADCWHLWENADPIVGLPGLDIPPRSQTLSFGGFALASVDTTFDLTFVIDVSGGDEKADFLTITVVGDPISGSEPDEPPADDGTADEPPTDDGTADLPPADDGPADEPPADDGNWDTTDGTDGGTYCSSEHVYDPAQFDNVLENFNRTSTLRLEGSQWNNTLVRNCRVHDTDGDGIFLKNVRNVVIQNCEVWNIGNKGIKLSSRGSTENVTIYGNFIHHIASDGIAAGQRYDGDGVDHKNLKIINNTIEDTGRQIYSWATHAIYNQAQDTLIEGNIITGPRDANGISIRSSGVVRCNYVHGSTRRDYKAAIKYFSDAQSGITNTLVIENNDVGHKDIGIFIPNPVNRKDGQSPPNHVVKNFIIRNNTIDNATAKAIKVGSDISGSSRYDVQVYDND